MRNHKLRNARTAAGLTALELAEKSGVDEMRIYALERGRGRLGRDEAAALADALGMARLELAPQWFSRPAEGGAQ